MMRRIKASVAFRLEQGKIERIDINAYTTDVACLIVHRKVKSHKLWTISHYPMGLSVLNDIKSRKIALEIVNTRLQHFNWTYLSESDWNEGSKEEKKKMLDAINRAVVDFNMKKLRV